MTAGVMNSLTLLVKLVTLTLILNVTIYDQRVRPLSMNARTRSKRSDDGPMSTKPSTGRHVVAQFPTHAKGSTQAPRPAGQRRWMMAIEDAEPVGGRVPGTGGG